MFTKKYTIIFLFKQMLFGFWMRFVLIAWILIISQNQFVYSKEAKLRANKDSLVEVRAVLINCESDTDQGNADSESLRFQRDELFKHNALRNCNKKVAVTVKMVTEAEKDRFFSTEENQSESEDEYIPIDHVFEGSERKRVRLLNPYILRLRRDAPRQAYKLQRIDTVSGVLSNRKVNARKSDRIDDVTKIKVRSRRYEMDDSSLMQRSSLFNINPDVSNRQMALSGVASGMGRLHELIKYKEKDHKIGSLGNVSRHCSKRKENHQIIYEIPNKKRNIRDYNFKLNEKAKGNNVELSNSKGSNRQDDSSYVVAPFQESNSKSTKMENSKRLHRKSTRAPVQRNIFDENYMDEKLHYKSKNAERDFALYQIGNPDLWYNVNVQLFEKLSSPEGKIVWNDLTHGELARVSSSQTEWKGQDLNVRYRPTEWVPREDYSLPMTSLCFIEPLWKLNDSALAEEWILKEPDKDYIIVPLEDVIGLKDKTDITEKRENDLSPSDLNEDQQMAEERHRPVEIRMSRAILDYNGDRFSVDTVGEDRYLTLPHRKPHHAQIDIEVQADDNQLVRVGSSGRISTVVADNSRKSRTVLSLQATNTGLASARFKVVARDCGPELTSVMRDKGREELTAGPILLPPQHTQRLHIDIPVELPVDITQCNVALLNDDDESVAVREVAIKKGDRCFCVWHCDCVCLSDDPKLLCREMSQPQQIAAGLSTTARPRHARSVCYQDNIVVDLASTVVGVITCLLTFGFLKAVIGLKCRPIGLWGLGMVLHMPRCINNYYESNLRGRQVVYDEQGYPVHPDTRQRTVQLVSSPMEFLLNCVIFVVIPSLVLCGLIRKVTKVSKKTCACGRKNNKDEKRVYNTRDLQGDELISRRKRRRRSLNQWMTPFAEELTTDVLQHGLDNRFCKMQPLLHETSLASKSEPMSAGDSEQDDTDYVLMQMQKSRESLARSQKKINGSALSSDRCCKKNNLQQAAGKR